MKVQSKARRNAILTGAACGAAALLMAGKAHAATLTWSGGGGDNNWSTGANWAGTAPAANDSLVFAGNTRPAPVNDAYSGTPIAGITFSAGSGAFTVSGGEINLAGATLGNTPGNFAGFTLTNGITNSSTSLQTIANNLLLSAGNHTFNGGAGGLALTGTFTRAQGGVAFFTPGAGNITTTLTNTNGIIGGWAFVGTSLATVNPGSQIVAYTAYTDIAAGAEIASNPASNVRITSAGAPLTIAAGVTTDINTLTYGVDGAIQDVALNAGDTLRLGASGAIVRTGTSNHAWQIGTVTGQGTLTAGGADNTPGEIVIHSGQTGNTNNPVHLRALITDNGTGAVRLVKTGQSAMRLYAANTYSGGTYISEGRVQSSDSASAFGTGPITIVGLGHVFLGAQNYANDWFLSGIGTAEAGGHGAIRLSNGTILSGTITLIGNTRLATRGNAGGGSITGKIIGNHALELGGYNNDAGDITTISSTENAWTGGTFISEQIILKLGNSEVIPHGTAAGNVTFRTSNDLDRLAILDLNGFNETINGLNREGSVAPNAGQGDRAVIRNDGGAAATLTIGSANANGSYYGRIIDNVSPVAITKIGSGVQTLSSGTNTGMLTYSGDTNIDGGVLAFVGNKEGAGAINVNTSADGAGILGGSGTIAGNVTLAANTGLNKAGINPGATGPNSVGVLSLTGSLTLNAGADLGIDLITPGASDAIDVAGTVSFLGATTISPVGGVAGTYSILTSLSPIDFSGGIPTINQPAGALTRPANYAVVTNATSISLDVSGGAKLITWGGQNGSPWDINSTVNWKDGVLDEKFFNGDSVTFGDGPTNRSVILGATVLPSVVNFTNSAGNDYTLSGAGAIGGTATLIKTGAGNLIITNNNTYSGTTSISAGVVQIGDGGTSGSLGTGAVTNDASLVFNRSDSYTVANVISGAGGLTKQGAGTLTLSGASAYTGNTLIEAGTLRVTTAANNGPTSLGQSPGGSVTVSNGASLDLGGSTGANALNFGQKQFIIEGAGVGGEGAIFNNGVNQQNALQRVQLTGDAVVNGSARIDIRAGQVDGTNSAVLDLQGHTLTKNGTNQFTLVATEVISEGNIVVNGGTFAMETTTVLGGTSTVTFNNGSTAQFFSNTNPSSTITRKLIFTGGNQIGSASNGNTSFVASPIELHGDLTIANLNNTNNTSQIQLDGVISEVGAGRSITKIGPTTANLTNANTFSGKVTISGGTVNVNVLDNGGLPSGIGQSTLSATNLAIAGGFLGYTGTAAASTDRLFTFGPGSGGILASGQGVAPVTFSNNGAITNATTGPATFTLGGLNSDANTFAPLLADGAGPLSVAKTGDGTWRITNNNTYTGATTISGGVLEVTSLANGGSPSNIGQAGTAAANLVIDNATFRYVGAGSTSDRLLTLGGTATLDASGTGPVVLNNSAALEYTAAGAGQIILTGNNTGSNTLAANINATDTSVPSLVKRGVGTWVLAGTYNVQNAIGVEEGKLSVSGSIAAAPSSFIANGATLEAAATQTMRNVNVAAGAKLQIADGQPATVLTLTESFTFTPDQSTIDLNKGGMIIDYFPGGSPIDAVKTAIINGFTGNWAGPGIISSDSATLTNTAVGYADSAVFDAAGSFMGQPADDSAILLRYTLTGDVNLDGAVTFVDLLTIAANFGVNNGNQVWHTGDVAGYDGSVTFTDLLAVAANFGAPLPSSIPGAGGDFNDALALAASSVPEPGGIAVLALGACAMLRRVRRSNR